MISWLQLDYDELSKLARSFRDDGEDLTLQYSNLVQRLQALRRDWIGESAEAFYTEMEETLLPALKRSYEALFFTDEAIRKIMSLVHQTDDDIAQRFKTDFGASMFAEAGAYADASKTSRLAAQPGAPVTDWAVTGFDNTPTIGDETGSDDDFGATTFEEAIPHGNGGGVSGGDDSGTSVFSPNETIAGDDSAQSTSGESSEGEPKADEKETASSQTGGGGGGAGENALSESGGLGNGLGSQPTNQFSVVGGGEVVMPDSLHPDLPSDSVSNDEIANATDGNKVGSSASVAAAGVLGAAVLGAAGKLTRDALTPSDDSKS